MRRQKPPPKPPAQPPLERFLVDFLPDGEAIARAPPPRAARAVLYALIALITAAVAWAAWAEVDQVVVASGKLIAVAPTVVVQPLETAVILSLDAVPGQRVAAGQRLATLDPTFAAADLADLRGRLAAARAKERRLAAEQAGEAFPPANDDDNGADDGVGIDIRAQAAILDRRRAEYAARLAGFDEQAGRLEATLTTSRGARAGLGRRIAVVAEIEAIRSQLHKQQTGSLLLLLEARNEKLRLAEELEGLVNRERETGFDLKKLAADRSAFIDEWRRRVSEELVEATRERATLAEQAAKAERRAALTELVAPVDAIVLETAPRSVGSVAREAEALFTLAPADAPLEAEVEILSADVGLARPGDPVRVKLDAFPFQRYGLIEGRLRTVSPDAFQREAARGGGAVFRARVELLAAAPSQAPAGTRLSPGMTAGAEIVVGKRSVLSYFLYPVIRALDESIREP